MTRHAIAVPTLGLFCLLFLAAPPSWSRTGPFAGGARSYKRQQAPRTFGAALKGAWSRARFKSIYLVQKARSGVFKARTRAEAYAWATVFTAPSNLSRAEAYCRKASASSEQAGIRLQQARRQTIAEANKRNVPIPASVLKKWMIEPPR